MKPQILLKKTIQKTKIFLHKTIHNIKSFLFGGYQKLPKAPYVNNPFYNVSNSSQTMQELDDFYRSFSEQWQSNNHDVECNQGQSNATERSSFLEISQKEIGNEEKKKKNELEKTEGKREELIISTDTASGGNHSLGNLAQKMKQFEMLDIDDVDHILDIEEVLHYYSRLKCPVYLELVDKFFMDMYSEFITPQPSVSINSSLRRLGPLKL
ncbi:hypothetical protein M9H77_36544 [Catharanthus roseus]|uniref:Uncharacterized protein n=1 Tax=Catharanthus roseus TaxID=4058 RepID=A0ACB9ZS44_CATRO|nr:hypothetical protein M9H77_36544 [Catharanthus roseus]